MTMLEKMYRHIPDPYPFMYLDGYTPSEILSATSRKMHTDYRAIIEEAQAEKDIEKTVRDSIATAIKDLFKDWK